MRNLVVVVGSEQVRVASRKRISRETGGDVIGPRAMRSSVLVGLLVPQTIFVELPGGDNQPSLSMTIEVRQGVPMCAELQFTARPKGPEVRDKDLRAVYIDDWIEQIVAVCSMPYELVPADDPTKTVIRATFSAPTPDDQLNVSRARTGRARVSQERLAKVAEIYRAHIDRRPTEAVRRHFNVSYRTAARWVELCRTDECGLLPKTTRGQRKA